MKKARILIAGALLLLSGAGLAQSEKSKTEKEIYGGATFLNKQDDGYRGIWYMINGAGQPGPVENQYRFKYSGGMATSPANHYPFRTEERHVGKEGVRECKPRGSPIH